LHIRRRASGQALAPACGEGGESHGASIPLACLDWANAKAAYRFFSNERVSEEEILVGRFHAKRSRFAATTSPVLVLQETAKFTFQRERPERIGFTGRANKGKADRIWVQTVCGLLMHSSVAVTLDGLPLDLSAIKLWTPTKFKGPAALRKKINLIRKESFRWLQEHAPVDRAFRRSNAMHPHRRPRERHLRAHELAACFLGLASTGWRATAGAPSLPK
jgi:hypothetical protein